MLTTAAEIGQRFRPGNLTDARLLNRAQELSRTLSLRELNIRHHIVSATYYHNSITDLAQSSALGAVRNIWNEPHVITVYYDRVIHYDSNFYDEVFARLVPLNNSRRRILRYQSAQGTIVVYRDLNTGEWIFSFSNTQTVNHTLTDRFYDEINEMDAMIRSYDFCLRTYVYRN